MMKVKFSFQKYMKVERKLTLLYKGELKLVFEIYDENGGTKCLNFCEHL